MPPPAKSDPRPPQDTPILSLRQTGAAGRAEGRGQARRASPGPGPGGAPVEDGQTAASALAGPHPPVRSLYLHVPFCFHKCHYCDFYSIVDTQDRHEAFTARLIDELEALAPQALGAPLATIFVGGGTPSLLAPRLWRRLLGALHDLYDLSLMHAGEGKAEATGGASGEFTVECNPETVTMELMDVLAAGGVTRVSIGAQSFVPEHLKMLERWHDPANVERAVVLARRAGIVRQSIDLIFAIPGQTVEDWAADLSRAIALGTSHLSCYNLTYEPNTAMTARLRAGQVTPVDEQAEAEMFELTLRTLRGAGLERYEVSNFARPGQECRHNLAYWRQEQWLAAGPSASGHVWGGDGRDGPVGSWRWKNVARLGDYLDSTGLAPVVDLEAPEPERLVRERIMTGLRLGEGLDSAAILRESGQVAPGSPDRLVRLVESFASRGLMSADTRRWVLTDEGFLLADLVASELMGAM